MVGSPVLQASFVELCAVPGSCSCTFLLTSSISGSSSAALAVIDLRRAALPLKKGLSRGLSMLVTDGLPVKLPRGALLEWMTGLA